LSTNAFESFAIFFDVMAKKEFLHVFLFLDEKSEKLHLVEVLTLPDPF
jgi:hypothetical protein